MFVREFPTTAPRASLVFLHGLGAHAGWFERMGGLLAERGVASWAFDYPGHGRSEGPRGDIRDIRRVLETAESLVERAPRPVFLCGMSLGGLLALHAAIRGAPRADGYIALSPPLADAYIPPLEKLAMLGALAVRPSAMFACPLAKGVAITADAATTQRMREDPLALTHVTARTYFQILTVLVPVLLRARACTSPVLMMLGARDRVVSPAAIRSYAPRVRAHLVEYADLGHDLKLEPQADRVADDMVRWMTSLAP